MPFMWQWHLIAVRWGDGELNHAVRECSFHKDCVRHIFAFMSMYGVDCTSVCVCVCVVYPSMVVLENQVSVQWVIGGV